MKQLISLLLIAFCSFGCAKNYQRAESKVLVIGDSISMGYTPFLKSKIAHVNRPDDNCKNSLYTLERIDQWISEYPEANVIVWNNGLWNSMNMNTEQIIDVDDKYKYTSLEDYKSHIIEIATKMKATGKRVMFFTTTEIHPTDPYFIYGREVELNHIAYEVLPSLGVEVYDLRSVLLGKYEYNTAVDNVHFTDDGSKLLAEFIKSKINR